MGTQEAISLEAFRQQTYSNLQKYISPFLAQYIASREILALADFVQNPIFDFTGHDMQLVAGTDVNGLYMFAPYCEEITYPVITDTRMYGNPIVLTEFKNIKRINQRIMNGDTGTGVAVYSLGIGDLSKMTKLQRIEMQFDLNTYNTVYKSILPTFSLNPDLETVILTGGALNAMITVSKTGQLATNIKLKEFRLRYLQTANIANSRAVIDSALSTLRTAKTNGGVISRIDFEGSPAPTGGAANADAVWLSANGVSVTLGTL